MLTVEQRHALVGFFEAAIAARRNQADARVIRTDSTRLDASVRTMIRCDAAEREFYEYLNLLTYWGEPTLPATQHNEDSVRRQTPQALT